MNTEQLYRDLSPQAYAALMDAAKLRALALRREAMGDLFRTLGEGLGRVWRHLAPGGRAQRLARSSGENSRHLHMTKPQKARPANAALRVCP